nr:paired amphipathic helix protein Sin3-like 3 isoform X1 [Tanacetum cinerariifolium]GEZ41732.1 paired amphipathic helix protein Sin3-like 3 isoform X1 [Tanacetum cinerariifolium]
MNEVEKEFKKMNDQIKETRDAMQKISPSRKSTKRFVISTVAIWFCTRLRLFLMTSKTCSWISPTFFRFLQKRDLIILTLKRDLHGQMLCLRETMKERLSNSDNYQAFFKCIKQYCIDNITRPQLQVQRVNCLIVMLNEFGHNVDVHCLKHTRISLS